MNPSLLPISSPAQAAIPLTNSTPQGPQGKGTAAPPCMATELHYEPPDHLQPMSGAVPEGRGHPGPPLPRAHRHGAAVALLAVLHHAVAADGRSGERAPPGNPDVRALWIVLEEVLKVLKAAAAKGLCPTDTSKTKDYPHLCACQHIRRQPIS